MSLSSCLLLKSELSIAGQNEFIPIPFHLVLTIVLYLILKNRVLHKIAWLVDLVAAFSLLYGTYYRTQALEGRNVALCEKASASDNVWISKYLVLSVVSWISLFVLEAKTCLQLVGTVLGKFYCPVRSKSQILKFCGCFLLASNSVVVMLHFCTDVHQTFEYLTNETTLILYYWIAAIAKILSVFMQGVYFCSWMIDHPVRFLPRYRVSERKLMFRMAFVNMISLCHSSGLAYFVVLNSTNFPWTFDKTVRVSSLAIDLCYKCLLCWWYHQNSYCCIWYSLQQKYSEMCIVDTVRYYRAEIVKIIVQHLQMCIQFVGEKLIDFFIVSEQYWHRRQVLGSPQQVNCVPETGPVLRDDHRNEAVIANCFNYCTIELGCVDATKPSVYAMKRSVIYNRSNYLRPAGELVMPSSQRLMMPSSDDCIVKQLLSAVYEEEQFPPFSCAVEDSQEHIGHLVVRTL